MKERQSELMSFSKFFSTSKKPLSKEGNISKELYGRLTEKRKKDKDITYTANTKSTTITNGNASMLVSNESNLILFDRFFSLFEMSLLISTNKSIRDEVYFKITNVSLNEIYVRKKGDIIQYVIGDIENVSNGLFSIFKSLIEGILSITMTIVMMFIVFAIRFICSWL